MKNKTFTCTVGIADVLSVYQRSPVNFWKCIPLSPSDWSFDPSTNGFLGVPFLNRSLLFNTPLLHSDRLWRYRKGSQTECMVNFLVRVPNYPYVGTLVNCIVPFVIIVDVGVLSDDVTLNNILSLLSISCRKMTIPEALMPIVFFFLTYDTVLHKHRTQSPKLPCLTRWLFRNMFIFTSPTTSSLSTFYHYLRHN